MLDRQSVPEPGVYDWHTGVRHRIDAYTPTAADAGQALLWERIATTLRKTVARWPSKPEAPSAATAAHRAGLTSLAGLPGMAHKTPHTAAAQRTDDDALPRGRFGPWEAGQRAGAIGAPGAASLPCRPIPPESMPRTAPPSDATVQHHGRRRRGCTP